MNYAQLRRMKQTSSSLLFLALLLVAVPSWSAISVSLECDEEVVTPGATFFVRIEVNDAGASFNGYETEVVYNTNNISYIEAVPSYGQEGSYFPSNCGLRHHTFDPTPGRLKVVHALFCGGLLLDGPGELYVLQFQAPLTPQTVSIQLQNTIFASAGLNVTPLNITNLDIVVGSTTDVPDFAVRQRLWVSAEPNPFNPNTRIRVGAVPGERSIQIYDPRGRLVRDMGSTFQSGDVQFVNWNGRATDGASLASGVYIVVVRQNEQMATQRVVLLR